MSLIGRQFGYREPPMIYCKPLVPVEVVKMGPPKLQKARVRYLAGEHEGLEEWVHKKRLVVPWEDGDAFLEDERRIVQVIKASEDTLRTVTYRAVEFVVYFSKVGVPAYFERFAANRKLLVIDDFEQECKEFGLNADELLRHPTSVVNRTGTYVAPFAVAKWLAQNTCERFPVQILRRIDEEEQAIWSAASPSVPANASPSC